MSALARLTALAVAALLPALALPGCSTSETAALQQFSSEAPPASPWAPVPPADPTLSSSADKEAPLLRAAATSDPAVGPAASQFGLAGVRVEGEWARADIVTDHEGLTVVFRRAPAGWEVADAGVFQVGCPLLSSQESEALGLLC